MLIKTLPDNPEAEIRRLIEDWAQGIRAKDIHQIMAHYAPDFRFFNLHSQLQSIGADAYRALWEENIAQFQGPVDCEIHDLRITAGETVAFCHSLNRIGFTLTGGKAIETWMRSTVCYQKIAGKWLAIHAHVSVPADMKSGSALLALKP